MLSKNMKNFIKLNEITKDYIFNFLNENNLIGKYIDILYVKPSAVKYYFCKVKESSFSRSFSVSCILSIMNAKFSG